MDIFKSILDLEKRIKQLREKREEALEQALPSAVAYKADKVQTSGTGNTIEDAVIRADEISRQITKLEQEQKSLQKQLLKLIKPLKAKERQVLYLRYINMERWKQIYCIMEISKQRTHKLHAQAKRHILERVETFPCKS